MLILFFCRCPGGGMADAEDLKSSGDFSSCGFDSHPGHQSLTNAMDRYSVALPGPFDLSLAVGHAEAHPRHAGMFLDAVRQRLRMRGNPELGVFRGAND